MPSRNLPVNIDSGYADDATHPDVKVHQQHHDAIHAFVNMWDDDATPGNGVIPFFNTSSGIWEFIDPEIAGSPGPQGEDGHGLRWMGAWDAGTSYTVFNGTSVFDDDVVYYNGSAYIALAAHTNSTPPDPDDAPSAYWDLLARQGVDGANGAAGQGFTSRGLWAVGTNYAAYDVVDWDGSSYVAVTSTTGSQPPSAAWTLIAQAGADGADALPAISEKVFTFPGEVSAPITGTLPWAPAADIVIDSVRLTASAAPDDTPVVVNVRVDGDPDAIWDDSGGYPTLAAGAISSSLFVPDHPNVSASHLVTVDTESCGSPSGAGTISYRDFATQIDDNNYTSRAIPIPVGYHVGDTLLCFVCHLAASGTAGISAVPSGWAQVPAANEVGAGPNQMWLAILGKVAGSGETGPNVTFGVSGKVVMITVAIDGMDDITGTYYDDIDTVTQDTQVSSVALPALVTTLTNQLGLWCYCLRHTNGDQQLITLDGSLTSVASVSTTSGAGVTNIAMALGYKALATATTYGALTASDTSQIGRWVGRNVALKVGAADTTPGEDVTATIAYHRA